MLLMKLNFCGLKGKELSWFRSYLTDRRQCCKVNGRISATGSITCDVPQGSCLGPPLFLVYINDLPSCLKNSLVSMHVDDSSVQFSSVQFSSVQFSSVQFSFILKFHNIQNSMNIKTSKINYDINYSNTYN